MKITSQSADNKIMDEAVDKPIKAGWKLNIYTL